MEQQVNLGAKMLNGFLRLMVGCLILILITIPIAATAHWMGFI